jgi:predicted AAA+ superfamily ATPase
VKTLSRPFVLSLIQAIQEHPELIHVVLGPRQVGKTTGVLHLLQQQYTEQNSIYVSADGAIQRPSSWLLEQWTLASQNAKLELLVIDEIQNVDQWSAILKQIWDDQKRRRPKNPIRLVTLGSSSLQIQVGLQESLAGRFFLHPVRHWDFSESKKTFGLSLTDYLTFGGYPGSYAFTKNPDHWVRYIQDSIVDPVLGKDILSQTRVKSPALFRQCFDLACAYAAQELSYTKLLGQLQSKGNTDLVKSYLELFEGAFLVRQLFKYSGKKTLTRSSSPKLLPLCPALYSVTCGAELNSEQFGHALELAVGAYLNTLPGELTYWRDKNFEVDYIYSYRKKVTAIEVKWGKKAAHGLQKFKEQYPSAELMIVTSENFEDVLDQLKS